MGKYGEIGGKGEGEIWGDEGDDEDGGGESEKIN